MLFGLRLRAVAGARVISCAFILAGMPLALVPACADMTVANLSAPVAAVPLSNGFVRLRDVLRAGTTTVAVAPQPAATLHTALATPSSRRPDLAPGTPAAREAGRRLTWTLALDQRLRRLELAVKAEQRQLQRCLSQACVMPGAAAYREAVARVRAAADPVLEAQRIVQNSIRYRADRAGNDLWQTPLQTFARGAGDCEDHAIAKRALLLAAGLADHQVSLVFLTTRRGIGHVVVEADTAGGTRLLDNRRSAQRVGHLIEGDRVLYEHRRADPALLARNAPFLPVGL